MAVLGNQSPTEIFVLPYEQTKGQDAIDSYECTGRTAQDWQKQLIYDILAVNDDGLWTHTKAGYSVPRRNGKNEVVVIRELYALLNDEKVLHTAHRTTTSTSSAERLAQVLDEAGYTEVKRLVKDKSYPKHYTFTKQMGLEKIQIIGHGSCSFRTRSAKGGLGEGYDLLVIDEAQEYTIDQESALKYVVSSSQNPQTLFLGTPPTAVSTGTVFPSLRRMALSGQAKNTYWAEWSIDSDKVDYRDVELWKQANPSLGTIISLRSVEDEITDDITDFLIQRLGLWISYSQASAISQKEWDALLYQGNLKANLNKSIYMGIKYGKDGANASVSIAIKLKDGRVFVEALDCQPVRSGTAWILSWIEKLKPKKVVIDGDIGQKLLSNSINKKLLLLPKTYEIIDAFSKFEEAVFLKEIAHSGQEALRDSATNSEHRAIGTGGGFGYKSIKKEIEVGLIESTALAYWICKEAKEKKTQKINY